MARPRFSQMLIDRRHQLGLTVSQASSVLKLREDVLIAFEEGDFERMPQSGYAQGMLSSYARYLGLNAREITDLFMEDYFEFKNGMSSHELRRRTRDTQSGRIIGGYDVVNEQGSRPKAYVQYRPLLPTGGGPAGDIAGFTTTTEARPHRSVPLAGTNAAPGTRGYSTSSYYGEQRSYNTTVSHGSISPSAARRRSNVQGRRDQSRQGSSRSYVDEAGYRRDDVSTRRVRAGEYADDRRFDDDANPYAPASTVTGRRSSRNIAQVERPNVRRRFTRSGSGSGSGSGGRGGSGRRGSGSSGRRGSSQNANSGRTLFMVVVLAALALTAILIFSVSSCVNSKTSTGGGQTVQVNNANDSSSSSGDSTTSSSTTGDSANSPTQDQTTSDTDADSTSDSTSSNDSTSSDSTDSTTSDSSTSDDSSSETVEETVVEVSLEQGAVSFLEIDCDGESKVADTVTGPWRQTYTVHDKIEISATKPEVVTVTNNGKGVSFSTKSSGRGTISIDGTPLQEDSSDSSSDSTSGETDTTTN